MYPPHGTGGFAEHRRYSAVYNPAKNYNPDHFADKRYDQNNSSERNWHAHNMMLVDCVDMALAEIRQQGANQYFPAQVWRIEQQRNRVLRFTAGGLGWDSEREIATLLEMLESLKVRIDNERGTSFVNRKIHPEKTECTSTTAL